jgi:molybdopterin-binding protein
MPRRDYTAREAADALGISLDTLRRWDRAGRIRTGRDAANRRTVPAAEVDRLRAGPASAAGGALSARNRFAGVVREVRVEGMVAGVVIEMDAPGRVMALITRDAVEDLGLRPGMRATAVVKATSVMVER